MNFNWNRGGAGSIYADDSTFFYPSSGGEVPRVKDKIYIADQMSFWANFELQGADNTDDPAFTRYTTENYFGGFKERGYRSY